MRKVLSFPVLYFHFPLQFLESQWSLLMLSYLNLTREMGERSAKIDSFAQAFSVAAELHSPAGVLDRLRRFISKTSRMRVYTIVEYKPTISNGDTNANINSE